MGSVPGRGRLNDALRLDRGANYARLWGADGRWVKRVPKGDDKKLVEEEGSRYIQLGNLITKARSQEERRKVQDVVDSSLAIVEKIRQIEELDLQAKAARPKVFVFDAENILKSTKTGKSVAAAAKKRARLKLECNPAGFFQYLFRERKQVRQARHGVLLHCGLVSIRFNSAELTSLQARWQKPLVDLAEACTYVLDQGWKYLTKSEFNLVAACSRLLRELRRGSLSSVLAGVTTLSRYWELENAWLLFAVDPAYPGRAISAIQRIIELHTELREKKDYLTASLEALLQAGRTPPGPGDFVLALNVQRSRRALSLADLIAAGGGPYLAAEDFDCSELIQSEINAAIEDTAKQLALLIKKIYELNRVKNFLPTGPTNEVDYQKLKQFYCDYTGSALEQFEKETGNILPFASSLITAFLQTAEPLSYRLMKRAPANPDSKTQRHNLDYEASRMIGLIDKINHLQTILPVLQISRFLAIKTSGQGASQFESEAVSLLNELSELFFAYATKMAKLLADIPTLEAGIGLEPNQEPDQQVLEHIADRDNFITAITLAYLASAWLVNHEIQEMLRHERVLLNEKKSLLQKLERLASREQWKVLVEQLDKLQGSGMGLG